MKKNLKKTVGLYTRGKIYYVRKIIPEHLRSIAGKREFVISLKTDDYELAISKYSIIKKEIEYTISTIIDGTYQREVHDFEHYSRLAISNGRILECFKDIAQKPEKLSDLVLTFEKKARNGNITKHDFQSFVNVKDTQIKLSEFPEAYGKIKMLELQNHNPRELASKIDPLKNACKKFIDFIQKNKHLKDVTREDARAFHKELQRRIYNKEIATNTANKCLTHLRVLIDTYHNENDIDKDNVFRGLRFTENQSKRSPLNTRYIANNWINNPVLDNTTQELKYMLWVMIDTGCGFKELCGLDPDTDIHLETEIPYIEIRENEKRKIKTSFRSRKIPLIGLALEAFQNFPRGFRSYNTCNGPTNASAALNKFLKSNNLFENNKQTVYSARHCFKDRLRNHNVPAEMQDYLMGHKSPGMGSHYGNGYSLQQMRDALLLIEKDFK